MNTRQKLTLGIAAIFMVTLTVIGVTYAYFVTRVNYTNGTATATIQTASLSATYWDAGENIAEVSLENVLPGTVTYQSFVVSNDSDVAIPFSIVLTTKLKTKEVTTPAHCSIEGNATEEDCTTAGGDWVGEVKTYPTLPEYVHSTLSGENLINKCYVSSSYEGAAAFPAECYDADAYNNIRVQLYRVSSDTTIDGQLIDQESYIANDFADQSGTCSDTSKTTKTDCDAVSGTWTYNEELQFQTLLDAGKLTPITTYMDGAEEKVTYVYAPYNASGSCTVADKTTKTDCDDASGTWTYNANENAVSLNRKEGSLQETVMPDIDGVDSTHPNLNYYLMRIEYVNVNKNQNIENNAYLALKVNITPEAVTQ